MKAVPMRLAASARPNAKRITEAGLAVALVLILYVFVINSRNHREPSIDVTLRYKHVIALDKGDKKPTDTTTIEGVINEPKKRKKKKKGLDLDENGQYDHEEVRKVIALGYSSQNSHTKSVPMQHCPCTRDIEVPSDSYSTSISTDGLSYDLTNTTCSRDAFERGSGQKVVGFSFYGDLNSDKMKIKGYFEGIVGNLELMRTFYPGWTMRLYFDLDDNHPAKKDICDLACSDPLLDLCHAGHLPGTPMVDARKVFPMNWRFFPTVDPQVDIFVCRDLDSRFSWREASAVGDWLLSDQPIHSMRDHEAHFAPLLGAAWGSHMLKKAARSRWRKSWRKILESEVGWKPRNMSGPDQQALQEYVWPWGEHNSLQHDAYLCDSFSGSVAFPTKRLEEPNNHVASVYNDNATYWKRCPIQCRPKDHKDWARC